MHPLVGRSVPLVQLGRLKDGAVVLESARRLFGHEPAVAIGIPGAFTPVCARQHLPDFIRNVPKLRAAGYKRLICIVANDPFVTEAWAALVDPSGEITFLPDGNLDFTRALGMSVRGDNLCIGERSNRYMMCTRNSVITHFRVESSVLDLNCTRAQDAIDAAQNTVVLDI